MGAPDFSDPKLSKALHKFLAIPPAEQPPDHYRLLALPFGESDLDVIETAADSRMTSLRTFQTSPEFGPQIQTLLNLISSAKITLLKPASKAAYDAELQRKRAASTPASVAGPMQRTAPTGSIGPQRPGAPRPAAPLPTAAPLPAAASVPAANPAALNPAANSPSPAIAVKSGGSKSSAARKSGPPMGMMAVAAVAVVAIIGIIVLMSSGNGTNEQAQAKPQDKSPNDAKSDSSTRTDDPAKGTNPTDPASTAPERSGSDNSKPGTSKPATTTPDSSKPGGSNPNDRINGGNTSGGTDSGDAASESQLVRSLFGDPDDGETTKPDDEDEPQIVEPPPRHSPEEITRLTKVLTAEAEKVIDGVGESTDKLARAKKAIELLDFAEQALAIPAAEQAKAWYTLANGWMKDVTPKPRTFTQKSDAIGTIVLMAGAGDPVALHTLAEPPRIAREAIALAELWRTTKPAVADYYLQVAFDKREDGSLDSAGESLIAKQFPTFTPKVKKPTSAKNASNEYVKGKWVEIDLANEDIKSRALQGEWQFKDKALVSSRAPQTTFRLPIEVQSKDFDFEFRISITRIEGNNAIHVMLPVGEGVAFLFDAWNDSGGYSGFSDVMKADVRSNSTSVRGMHIPQNKECTVVLRATRKANQALIQASLNGKPFTQWEGPIEGLSPIRTWNGPLPKSAVCIGTTVSGVAFRNIAVKLHSGKVVKDINAPDEPEPAAEVTEASGFEKGKWTDIDLARLDVSNHQIAGKWQAKDGWLSCDRSDASITLPVEVQSDNFDVEIKADVSRNSGDSAIELHLPVGVGVNFGLDAWSDKGGFSGLNAVDGLSARDNPASVRGLLISKGKPHTIAVRCQQRGTRGTILGTLDGKTIVQWQGDVRSLSTSPYWQKTPRNFGLHVYMSPSQFRNIAVKVHSGKVVGDSSTERDKTPVGSLPSGVYPQGKWTDINLAQFDVASHVERGKWQVKDNALWSDGEDALMTLPVEIQSDQFNLEFKAEISRDSGDNAISVTLPIGKSVAFTLDSWPDRGCLSGLQVFDRMKVIDNPDAVRGVLITPGKTHTVAVRCQQKGNQGTIFGTADGKPIVQWQGEIQSLSPGGLNPKGNKFGLYSHRSRARFSNISVKVNSGKVVSGSALP